MKKTFKISFLIATAVIFSRALFTISCAVSNSFVASNEILPETGHRLPAVSHTEMDTARFALMLTYEIGGAYKDESIKMVASTVINQYTVAKKYTSNLTITDVLYRSGNYSTGPNSITGPYTKNFSKKDLENAGIKRLGSKAAWDRLVRIAEEAMSGGMKDYANTGYAYNKSYVDKTGKKVTGYTKYDKGGRQINTALDTNPLYNKKNSEIAGHRFYKFSDDSLLGAIKHYDYNMDPNVGTGEVSMEGVIQFDAQGKAHKLGSSLSGDLGDRDRTGICSMLTAADIYLSDSVTEATCWYCKIVVVLTNAYFKAAASALPSAIALGKLCAKVGFMIWLAYYILLQVSSMSPIAPFKMLQEVLVMGFKVALAYLCVTHGSAVISDFFIKPIVGLGVDYGSAIMSSLMASHNVDGIIEGIQKKIDEVRKEVNGSSETQVSTGGGGAGGGAGSF